MYRGFNLKLDKSIFTNEKQIQEYCKYYKDDIDKYSCILYEVMDKVENLNGNEIMRQWFPVEELKFDIFLSHSHKDLILAVAIAGKLKKEHNLNVFIDSLFWGDYNDLLKNIDNKYCKIPNRNSYYYHKRNHSTAHIHMILMNSLNLMIDGCEALFFLNTPNSISHKNTINKITTYSPWIFSEIQTSQIIRKKTPERLLSKTKLFSKGGEIQNLNESMSPQMQIEYQMELSHLKELNAQDFDNWIEKSYISPNDALNTLYKMYPLENIKFEDIYINFLLL